MILLSKENRNLIGQRIKARREALGLIQQDLADALGYTSKTTIAKIEKGLLELSLSKTVDVAKALQTSPAYLMGWIDNPELTHQETIELEHQKKRSPQIGTPYNPIMHKIPILGFISAGLPLYADQNIEGYTYTDLNHGAEYFALRVKGDSMDAAKINDGDILIVRRQPEVENGEIAVVMVDDENATVKRFRRDGSTVFLIPQSFNPEHQTQIYNLEQTSIRIIGKAMETKTVIK